MRKPKHQPAQQPKEVTEAHQPPPDPVDVLTQHWADLTGWTRKEAAAHLIYIGHALMKVNNAGVNTYKREIESAIAAKEAREESEK